MLGRNTARLLTSLAWGAAGCVILTASVHAQEAASSSSSEAEAAPPQVQGLEEVVVTARRKSERLIDVPVAATVVSGAALATYGTVAFNQLQVPGLVINQTGAGSQANRMSIRGIGASGADFGEQLPIVFDVDGVPISDARIIDAGLFDLDSLQILKGPQALYFGKNSPAGVIVLDSVNPGDKENNYIRGSYGFAERDPILESGISVTVTDTLAVRAAVHGEDMLGGYLTNQAQPLAVDPIPDPTFKAQPTSLPGPFAHEFPQTKELIGRITAVWKPTSRFDATVKQLAAYHHANGSFYSQVLTHCQGAHPVFTPTAGGPSYTDPFATCGPSFNTDEALPPAPILDQLLNLPSDRKPYDLVRQYLTSARLNYRLHDVTLTSVTGWYSLFWGNFDNYDSTVFAGTPVTDQLHTGQFTEELRAATGFDSPVNFSGGAFFEKQNKNQTTGGRIAQTPLLPPGLPNQGQYAGTSNSDLANFNDSEKDYSLYGEATWQITHALALDAGVRWTEAQKASTIHGLEQALDLFFLRLPGGPDAHDPLLPAGAIYQINERYTNFSPEATLSWHPAVNVLVYGAFKTGFLPGGISNPGVPSNFLKDAAPVDTSPNAPSLAQVLAQNLVFKPEKAKGGELGAKGSLLAGRLQGDLTLYRYVFTDLQISTFHPATATFFIGNAGSSLDEGVELNAAYAVSEQFSLHGGLEYSHLYYRDYANAPCYPAQAVGCVNGSQSLSGQPFGPAPLSITLGGRYNRPLTDRLSVGLTADATAYNRSPLLIEQPYTSAPAYTVVNASLRLYQPEGPWEASLIGTNLGNTVIISGFLDQVLGSPQNVTGSVEPGREVRLQVTYHGF